MSQTKDLSEAELIRRVEGTTQPPLVTFYEKAHLDKDESQRLGRRVYKKVVMIEKRAPGQDDWAPAFATKRDFETYPDEYRHFLNSRTGRQYPGIETLPGLDETERQYLMDLGFTDIRQLAESEGDEFPEELQPAKAAAIALYSTLKGLENGKSETGPAPTGQRNDGDVGRRAVPAGGEGNAGGLAEGLRPSGPFHGHERPESRQGESRDEGYQDIGRVEEGDFQEVPREENRHQESPRQEGNPPVRQRLKTQRPPIGAAEFDIEVRF